MFRVQRAPENPQQRSLEELVACNQTGKFERFGDHDIAFVCDFCDGFIIWDDLREMPSSKTLVAESAESAESAEVVEVPEPTSATSMAPAQDKDWKATGFRSTDGTEKTIVFAPVAIANHMPPLPGEWQARILCPFCEDYYTEEQGEDDMERIKWHPHEGGFSDMIEFEEHLEWSHAPTTLSGSSNCSVM